MSAALSPVVRRASQSRSFFEMNFREYECRRDRRRALQTAIVSRCARKIDECTKINLLGKIIVDRSIGAGA